MYKSTYTNCFVALISKKKMEAIHPNWSIAETLSGKSIFVVAGTKITEGHKKHYKFRQNKEGHAESDQGPQIQRSKHIRGREAG